MSATPRSSEQRPRIACEGLHLAHLAPEFPAVRGVELLDASEALQGADQRLGPRRDRRLEALQAEGGHGHVRLQGAGAGGDGGKVGRSGDLERTVHRRLHRLAGANVGQTALRYAAQYPHAVIHSFEPTPATFRKLSRNVANQQRIVPYEMALSDSEGETEFFTSDHDVSNSMLAEPGEDRDRIRVKCTTLDRFCHDHDIERIDLLKLDAEGIEPQILRGAPHVFERMRPRVVISELTFCGGEDSRGNGIGVIHQLQEYGYRLFGVYNHMYPRHIGAIKWLDGLFVPDGNS